MTDLRPEPEADLVRACADGDAAAWERFVDRYGALLGALARKMLARRTGRATDTDVDEVVAGVFLALLKGERRLLRRYRPEFRVSTYLGVICRTEVSRYLRTSRRGPALLGEDADATHADPGAPTPLVLLAKQERDDAVRGLLDALGGLAPRDRLLLTLKYVDGLDYARIADVLRVRPDSVGQLLHRAKERLAKRVPELAQWVDDESESS